MLGCEYETPDGKRTLNHAGNFYRGYVTTNHKALSHKVKDFEWKFVVATLKAAILRWRPFFFRQEVFLFKGDSQLAIASSHLEIFVSLFQPATVVLNGFIKLAPQQLFQRISSNCHKLAVR